MVAGDRIAEIACSGVDDGRTTKDGKENEGFLSAKKALGLAGFECRTSGELKPRWRTQMSAR
jgi:hypothetical protein